MSTKKLPHLVFRERWKIYAWVMKSYWSLLTKFRRRKKAALAFIGNLPPVALLDLIQQMTSKRVFLHGGAFASFNRQQTEYR